MVSFPKKKWDKCSLSIPHAIAKQPIVVKKTDVNIKSIPVGSNCKTGRNTLHKIVKIGENRSITRVF